MALQYTKFETAWKMCPIFVSQISVKCQGNNGQKIADFDPNWAFRDLTPVEFTDGFEMMT